MKWNRHQSVEYAGSVGAALLIAGYLRYSIQGELLLTSKILMIAGGALAVAAIILGYRNIIRFFSKRSSQLGTNTTVLAIAVLAILSGVNYLGYQHHKRFDLTAEKLYTLSDQTKKIVAGLKQDVTIARFAKPASQQFDDLMAEYTNLSHHLKFEDVDPQEKPEVAKQFGATRVGDVVVASGSRTEHPGAGAEGNPSEQDMTAAIMKVTQDKVKTVCFVTGHGEKSLTDDQASGYKLIDQGLQKEGYLRQSINLVAQNGVPATCDVVVIAGPTGAFFPQETAMIAKYLDDGGKALIEIDPETDPKLDSVLQAWNVSAGQNVVVDASGVGRLFGMGPAVPLVTDYGDSPITKGLQRGMTFFPLARTVSVASKTNANPEAVEILKTSPRSFTIPNLNQKEVTFDPKTDTAGPLSLGVAISRKVGEKSGRLVVIGDSDFAADKWVGLQENGDLFYNTIDWLAQDENLISIRPKEAANRRVTLTEGQNQALWWLDLIFLPGIVIFSGIYIWWKRR